jgi:hypothetical protein
MGGSHCDSRPFPLSGQVAIFWIGLGRKKQRSCARRSSTAESPATSVSLRGFSYRDCAILHSFQDYWPRPKSPPRCSVKPTCNIRRAMAQMCYVEKWKLADVLDIAHRGCEDAQSLHGLYESNLRGSGAVQILGSRISGNQ